MVTPDGHAEQRYVVPVATQALFRDVWMAGASALGLRWVPLFETGTPLTQTDLPLVIDELTALRIWAEASRQPIVDRLQTLIAELEKVRGLSAASDIFIG